MAERAKVISWNVRGMGDANKRYAIFNYLQQFQPAIVVLQETHLSKDSTQLVHRAWVSHSFHATHTTHSRGVSILVHRGIPFQCIKSIVDSEGRYVCVHCRIYNVICLLIAVYVPPPYSSVILRHIVRKIQDLMHLPCLIVGDFNMYIDIVLDKFQGVPLSNNRNLTTFGTLLKELMWVDVWRFWHPEERLYSCQSSTYQSLSRIDMALGSYNMLPYIKDVQYHTRTLSDHSPMEIRLQFNNTTRNPKKYWKINPFWLKIIPCIPLVASLREFMAFNIGSVSDNILWDTMKAFLRGELIQNISRIKSKNRGKGRSLQCKTETAEAAYIRVPSRENLSIWKEAQESLRSHWLEVAEYKRFFNQQTYYEEGEGTGKLLARVAQAQRGSVHIAKLIRSDGTEATEAEDILGILRDFYRQLYSSRIQVTPEEMRQYLGSISLPALSEEQKITLDSPLRKEELEMAIKNMPNEKAPGIDGLPIEIYKMYNEVMIPQLLDTLNSAFQLGSLPASMRDAIIVVLPKPGKDPTSPDSYRPISLLTTDVKVLAKVLAQRIFSVITTIIHQDQTGFMPGKSTAINLRRLFLNLQTTSDNVGERVVLSLDAAKAFDSIEWQYLWAVMSKMGFGPNILKWVKLLYSRPRACIQTNGMVSEMFSLERGTRQGCPLSPFLFAIAIEPLAAQIRHNKEITGFRYGRMEEKVALYADDMLLFLGDSNKSLNAGMNIIKTFGNYTGLRINWDKSVLMPVDLSAELKGNVMNDLQCVSSFTYLGVTISMKLKDYIILNIYPLLNRWQSKISAWNKLALSLIGRANLIKMILMPQMLYLLHNSPIWIPSYIFQRINRLFRQLLWKASVPRIKLEKLQLPIMEGGLAVPNMWLYFLASQIQHFVGWSVTNKENANAFIIEQIVGTGPLLPRLETSDFISKTHSGPTYQLMHKVWEKGKQIFAVEGSLECTPLWHNGRLSEINKLPVSEMWLSRGITRIAQLYKDDILKSFSQLQEEFSLPKTNFYYYLQMRHAIQSQQNISTIIPKKYYIYDMLRISTGSKGFISRIYRGLHQKHGSGLESTRSAWEQDVGTISLETWDWILAQTPKLSLSPSYRMSQILLIHRVYRTPAFLHRIGVRDSARCGRCAENTADLIHMFWRCPILKEFWAETRILIKDIFKITVPEDPLTYLLGYVEEIPLGHYEKIAIGNILYQARKVIASYWLDTKAPTIKELVNKVSWTIRLEKGIYVKRGTQKKYNLQWDKWIEFHNLKDLRLGNL